MNQLFQNYNDNSNNRNISNYNHQSSFNAINTTRNNNNHRPQMHVIRTNTITKKSNPSIDAQTIYSDPSSATDPRWFWRTRLESLRSDPRNIKHYVNYVGSKGARSFESNSNPTEKKPDHYKKHLVKIGCPLHDLFTIFHTDLGFTVHPTICSHKSWKCPPISSYSKHTLLANVSMNEVGLEWKRGAFSVKPLHIQYGNTFSTDLYIKRIANTNFNKVFRPGSFGNLPSVKKGSWKQGKVFYVFKDDKLVLNINNIILLVFELSSPSTIIKHKQNKHDIIDGWKNIVGGVGFYCCAETKQNIATVLILRKSTEFPTECIKQSNIKILLINNGRYEPMYNGNNKLIIGSKTFDLNESYNSNNTMDKRIYGGRNRRCNLSNMERSRNRNRSRSRSRERGNRRHSAVHSDNLVNVDGYGDDRSIQSLSCVSYANVSSSVSISMDNNYSPPYYNNNNNNTNYTETKECDDNSMDDKFQSIINSMRTKFEHDNTVLTQRNQFLTRQIPQLQKLNAQFMDLNGKLMDERDQLLNRIQTLQNTVHGQNRQIHELNQSQLQPMINNIAQTNNSNTNMNMNMHGVNNMNHTNTNIANCCELNQPQMIDDMNTNMSYMNNITSFNTEFDNNSMYNTDPMFCNNNYSEFELEEPNHEFQLNSGFC